MWMCSHAHVLKQKWLQVGLKCVRLEGSMSMDARDRMIKAFTDDPDVKVCHLAALLCSALHPHADGCHFSCYQHSITGCQVFLMSLKAGGVALNLTAASHVMLMDPWWNPAVEQQV